MNRKLLFSLVMMLFGFTMPALAQETLTFYDGEATNAYVPVYGFYADAYNKCEYIMPSDDLSELTGATLTKMTWYLAASAEAVWGGNFQVYLKEVDANACGNAFMGTDGATLVFEGPLDGTGSTIEIEFANPYTYEGGNLLVCVYQVEKGTYKSATFAGVDAPGAALSNYSYTSLEAITTANARNFLPKTTFEFTPGSGTVYYKPKNLQVSEIGTNSAVLTWEAGANEASWNVECKKAADEEWTAVDNVTEKTITLQDLQNGVKYDVRVQSVYADGESGWTMASFATLACEASDMGEVEYVLTDSYGDGWNNNHLMIYLAGTDVLVADLFIPGGVNGTPNDNYAEGIVNLCYGVDYDLVWVAGSYAYETGFTLTAPSGEVIYEYQGTGSSGPTPTPGVLTTFHINQVTCPRPTDVVVSNVVYNGADVTWTPGNEEQDLFEVACTTEATPDNATPISVNEPTCTLTDLEENTTYNVFVRSKCSDEDVSIWTKAVSFTTPLRFPLAEGLAVSDITAYTAKATWTGVAEAYNLRFRPKTGLDESFEYDGDELPDGWIPAGVTLNDADGDGNSWQVLKITDWNMGGTPLTAAEGDYCIVSESVTISGGTAVSGDNWLISPKVDLGGTLEVSSADLGDAYAESFSVMVSTTGTDFVVLGTVNTLGSLNTWQKSEFDLSDYAGQQGYIAIRHQPNGSTGYILMIDAIKIAGEDVPAAEWTVMEGVTSPATMEGLSPNTTYEVQVQGVFEDGNSAWCDVVNFTTVGLDVVPVGLEVTEVTGNTGTVNWTGSQDNYNLRYRTAAVMNGVTEDFLGYETGDVPEGWTLIDADGDGQNWYVWNLTLDDGTVQTTFSSNSYINNYGPLTPDNWAITPQSKLGAQVKFDAWGQDPNYAGEHFQVYVSTTGTAQADFEAISDEIIATGAQTTYTFDIPADKVGQMGYIAIRHFNVTDMYILNVTNFYMAGEEDDVPAGEWIEINNVTPPYTITGLAPATAYEVQVQGIYERALTDWTNSVFFTTAEQADGISEFYMVGSFNGWDQTEEGGRYVFEENENGDFVVQASMEEGAEFKIITPDETSPNGWKWFGGIDENQVGYFLINSNLYDIDIQLVDGSNFRIEEEGEYLFTIKQARGLLEPLVMTVTQVLPTAINDINSENGEGVWYNVQGMKLRGVPAVPGIYIHNGKKVVVK